ncbi:MAG: hypothetical protein K2M87_05740, partial [Muribaculaceae bacterium]|nr:hypothetical protein [Muribaculaceae bacterium]
CEVALLLVTLVAGGCNNIDDNAIPNLPVYIDLAGPALWQTYGVGAFGQNRRFIKSLGEPRDFAYSSRTYTGFGGVLLVCGFNPFTTESMVPMAFDLSCPVEAKPDVRVAMQTDGMLPQAVCPVCGSHYNVCEQAGAPMSGPAKSRKLGLKRYECRQSQYGGYLITDY